MKKLFLAALTFISTQAMMAQTLEKCNGSMNRKTGR